MFLNSLYSETCIIWRFCWYPACWWYLYLDDGWLILHVKIPHEHVCHDETVVNFSHIVILRLYSTQTERSFVYSFHQGIQGNIGTWGEEGTRGPPGNQGPQGPAGPHGVAGYPVSLVLCFVTKFDLNFLNSFQHTRLTGCGQNNKAICCPKCFITVPVSPISESTCCITRMAVHGHTFVQVKGQDVVIAASNYEKWTEGVFLSSLAKVFHFHHETETSDATRSGVTVMLQGVLWI